MTETIDLNGTEVAVGDEITLTILDDGEEAETNPMAVSAKGREDQVTVEMDGQRVGTVGSYTRTGSHRVDAEVIGALDLAHEEGVVRDVVDVVVA